MKKKKIFNWGTEVAALKKEKISSVAEKQKLERKMKILLKLKMIQYKRN